MSINVPCLCIKMFHSVTTKQSEICHHTQRSKVEGKPSKKGNFKSTTPGSKVLMIFSALTVSGFVTNNDVKSYKFDTLIVRCTVSHLHGLSELTLTQVHTMQLLKKCTTEKIEAGTDDG